MVTMSRLMMMMMTHIVDILRCWMNSAPASRVNSLIFLTVFVSMALGAHRMMQSGFPFPQICHFLRPSSLIEFGSVMVQTWEKRISIWHHLRPHGVSALESMVTRRFPS